MRITKYLDSPNIIYFFEKYDDDFEPTGTRNFNGSPYDLLRDLDFIYYSPAPLQKPCKWFYPDFVPFDDNETGYETLPLMHEQYPHEIVPF